MAARIHLVRHGVCAHEHDGSWIGAEGQRRFIELYDAAGIRGDPPLEVVELARTADVLAASTLRRATESVQRLAPGRDAHFTPLLRESPFELARKIPLRLPVGTWDAINFAVNGFAIWRRWPSPELARAREATEWLLAKAPANGALLAVTHGDFRRFLWAALVDRGWRAEFTRKTYHNWSVWSFRAP
jgi:hypothetical protein